MSVENPRDIFASGPRVSIQMSGKDMFEEMEEPEEGSIFDIPLGVGEAGLSLGTGMANWMMASAMKGAFTVGQGILKPALGEISYALADDPEATKRIGSYLSGISPESISREGAVAREGIQKAVDLMIPAFEPKTGVGQKIIEPVSKAIEFVTWPARKIESFLTRKGYGNAGYLAGLTSELAIFKALHVGGKKAVLKIKEKVVKKKLRRAQPEDFADAEEILRGNNEPELANVVRDVALMEDAAKRGKAIGDLDIGEAILREEMKALDAREAVPPEVPRPEAKITPLLKPKKPSIEEGQEHFRRTQDMTRRLNAMVKKARESGVVLSDKNKIDVRKAREEVQRAETLREDARQVPSRRRDVIEEGKREGREDIQRIEEERRGEVKEEALEDLPSYKSGTEATSDGWVLNRRRFTSRNKAEKKLESLRKERGPELEAEEGLGEIQVIKIGKASYRVGVKEGRELDPQIEALARKEFGEESMPYGTNLTKGAREAIPELNLKMEPEMVEARAAELMKRLETEQASGARVDYNRYLEQADPLSNDSYVGDSRYINANDAVDALVSKIRRDGNLQRPNNIMKHPIEYKANTGAEIVLNENLEAFKSPFEAANYAEVNGLEGRPWKDPDLGWVIERGGRVAAEMQTHKEFKWYKGKKSYYEILKKASKEVLKGKKGAIEIERLSTKQKESIRRFATRSIKAGMDMEEYLVRQGIDPKGAKDLKVAAIALDQKRSIVDPYVTDFETGKEIQTTAPRKFAGKEFGVQKVYEGEGNILRKGKDISAVPILKWLRNPNRVLREAGLERIFGDKYVEVVFREMERHREWMSEIKIQEKKLSFKEAQQAFYYDAAKQEKVIVKGKEVFFGRERLKHSGVKEKNIPERISPKQEEFIKWARESFDKFYNEHREVRESLGKTKMAKYEDNYWSYVQAITWAQKYGLKNNPIVDSAGDIMASVKEFTDLPVSWRKKRTKGQEYKLVTDPFYLLRKYGTEAISYAEMSPFVAKVHSLRRVLKFPGEKRRYFLKRHKPNLDKFLFQWANHLARRDHRIPVLDPMLNKLNENLAYAVLGGNVRSALIQTTALVNANARIGTPNLLYGIEEAFRPRGWSLAMRKSKAIPLAYYNVVLEQAVANTIRGRYGKYREMAGRGSLWPLKILDIHARVATWNGALRLAKQLAKNGEISPKEIYAYADRVVFDTQASGLPGHRAPIQWTALGRSATLFQTFVINNAGFLLEDVMGYKNPNVKMLTGKRGNRSVMKNVLRIIVGTTLANIVLEDIMQVKSPLPTPIRAVQQGMEDGDSFLGIMGRVGKELAEPWWFGGNIRYASSFLGPVAEHIRDISRQFSDDPFKRAWWEVVGKQLGIPATGQEAKIVRGIKRGADPWETIVGPVERPKRGRGGGLPTLKGL